MLVCVNCKKEMKCEQNGLGVRFGRAHVYPGDKYKCPVCDVEIINTESSNSIHDPEFQIDTILMDEK